MAALFVAGATDPVIGRALARLWNLLALPADLAADPVTAARMLEVMSDPDAYPSARARRPDPGRAARRPGAADRRRGPADPLDDPEALTHG